MLNNNEQVNQPAMQNEEIVRPLGRVTARELNADEIASVGGGWTDGHSNFGGRGDIDYQW